MFSWNFSTTCHWALREKLARPFWCEVPPKSLSDSRIGFEMTLMRHLLVAVVLDERGLGLYQPCAFSFSVTDISKILKSVHRQTTDIFNHRSGDRISTIDTQLFI